jgi:hypothetical protein
MNTREVLNMLLTNGAMFGDNTTTIEITYNFLQW